ncbi:MAG: 50S ribosomal protein L22 [Candidatus Aminicenantes bacterium]|nr:50S ribosomal protein L22 [Candidatus Aminicenantes bacterium]
MGNIAVARGKYLKMAPRKSRLVIDLIRGKDAGEALTILKFSRKKKASGIISQVLDSAIANAQVKYPNINVDKLYISEAYVDKAPYLKRFRAAPRGRGLRILKRYCHITIHLGEREEL